MSSGQRFHRLTEAELTAIAEGNYNDKIIGHLKAAQYSRNALLVETLRRGVRASGDPQLIHVIESAIQLLSGLQTSHPGIVTKLLITPHFGFWAADCVLELQRAASRGQVLSAELRLALCRIVTFAATAALMADRPFDLTLPVNDGTLHLPGIGRLHIAEAENLDYARVTSDRTGCEIVAGPARRRMSFPRLGGEVVRHAAGWTPAAKVRTSSCGVAINLLIDDSDPFLSRLGPTATLASGQSLEDWRSALRRSWRILVRYHEPVARALSAGLTTLIPLQTGLGGHPISMASGWAWGAVALTLPADPLVFTETLIHEFQHLVLAAIEDIVPLTVNHGDELHYSPWRNDPRPTLNVLQGSFAFLGVMSFWRRQCAARPVVGKRRAEIEFALQRHNVTDALTILSGSTEFTTTGRFFLRAMRAQVLARPGDQVSPAAEKIASEIASEHHLRWRLANLRPDNRIVNILADAWLANPRPALDRMDVPTELLPSPISGLVDRSSMLVKRPGGVSYRTPRSATRDAGLPSSGDLALMHGDLRQARGAYLRRIAKATDPDAWIGLLLVLRRLGVINDSQSGRQRIEVAVAVAERIRIVTGRLPDAQALFLWLRSSWGEGSAAPD